MIYQLLSETIANNKPAILYQTGCSIEIDVIKERYESMGWRVWIKEV